MKPIFELDEQTWVDVYYYITWDGGDLIAMVYRPGGKGTRPKAKTLARALRRTAQGRALSSLDVPLLEDAADALDAAQTFREAIEQLSKKWGQEAHEIDQDGDFCCAQTRRHDAGELFELVRDAK